MRIQGLRLNNFRGHKNITMGFDGNLTVIAGENGAGKSSILDAISIGVSWIVSKIKNSAGRGTFIKLDDINIDFKEASIDCMFDEIGSVTINAKNIGGKAKVGGVLDGRLIGYYKNVQNKVAENIAQDLPIFAHYGVRRAVIDIPLRVRSKSHDYIFETYDDWNKGGANFKSFFEWFRNQEDIENEKLLYWGKDTLFMKQADNVVSDGEKSYSPDRELSAVRRALEVFMPTYRNVRVSRRPLRMLIDKGDNTLNVEQLSDGEKIYFALIGDLCRRLVLANPTLRDPLQGVGIVLIDEIDLHLHPSWQKDISIRLTEVFPNIQFILTTHSPLVINNIQPSAVRTLNFNDGNISVSTHTYSYGIPSEIIMKDIMGLDCENDKIGELLDNIYSSLSRNNIDDVIINYNEMIKYSPDHPELSRIRKLIERKGVEL